MSEPADRFAAAFRRRGAESGAPRDRTRRDSLAANDRSSLA
jgi:hypothetical protein